MNNLVELNKNLSMFLAENIFNPQHTETIVKFVNDAYEIGYGIGYLHFIAERYDD